MKKFIFALLFLIFLTPTQTFALEKNNINVHIFTTTGCSFCAKTLKYLDDLKKTDYSNIEIADYDLRLKPEYYNDLKIFTGAYNATGDKVPITFIGNEVIYGADLEKIKTTIDKCSISDCPDPEDIAKQFAKDHPDAISAKTSTNPVGWLIIIVLIVGVGLVILNKKS